MSQPLPIIITILYIYIIIISSKITKIIKIIEMKMMMMILLLRKMIGSVTWKGCGRCRASYSGAHCGAAHT